MSDTWNAACLRLQDYLRVHRVQDRERLLRLNLELLEEAKKLHAAEPARTPVDVAMSLATARTEEWFSRLAGSESPDARFAALGRAAWFASGLHREWSSAFLDSSPPPELLAAVRAASMQAGPALEFSSLTRAEMDYGPMEDIAEGTWQQFSWGHVLRAFVIWLVLFFVAYGVWFTFFHQ